MVGPEPPTNDLEKPMNVHFSNTLIKGLIAGCALMLVAGCATSKQLEAVQAEAAEARRMAEEAQSTVENVRSMVEEALAEARAASDAAEAAQNCCTDLERKLDRALQEMQQK
jgi:predicted  nucleic acid-binding Zn-ribbon protein